jgi:hypothetical protein
MTPGAFFDQLNFYTNRNDTVSDLANFAASATGRLNTALRDHPRMYRQGTHRQPAQRVLLPLPYDCLQLRSVERGDVLLRQYPQSLKGSALACSSIEGFIERGDCIELLSPPQEETEYKVGYSQALTPPTSGGASSWVLEFFPDVLLYATLAEIAVAIKDRENGPIWQQEAARRIAELANQGWNQNIAVAPRVRVA